MAVERHRPHTEMTESQVKFAKGVAAGMNLTEAARQAGYSTPMQEGHRLLKNDNVRGLIFKEQELNLVKLGAKAAEVIAACLESESEKVRLKAAEITLKEIGRVRDRAIKGEHKTAENLRSMTNDDFQRALLDALNRRNQAPIINPDAIEVMVE